MPQLIIALVIVIGGWWMLRKLCNVPPAQVRVLMRKLAGAAIMAVAAFLALRGEIQPAIPLFLLGLGMFGQFSGLMNSGAFWRKQPGRKSQVSTALLNMELDHDSGAMDGTVLAGPLQGRQLSGLTPAELLQLRSLCESSADQSLALLEAWLDRARPGWRGTEGSAKRTERPGAAGAMTLDEAYAILGLQAGATPDQIRSAHKRLMKQFHPDTGGSTYIAAKINLAKDKLLQD